MIGLEMTDMVEMIIMKEATGEARTDTMIETGVEEIGLRGMVEKTHEGEVRDVDTMTGVNTMLGKRMIIDAQGVSMIQEACMTVVD